MKLANIFDRMGLEEEADLLDEATTIIIENKSTETSECKKDFNDNVVDEKPS